MWFSAIAMCMDDVLCTVASPMRVYSIHTMTLGDPNVFKK